MLKVVVTAGGTSESIDGVRRITNCSTGTLSSMIAERFVDYGLRTGKDLKLYYIHTDNCKMPSIKHGMEMLKFINATSTYEVKDTVEKLLTEEKIDLFVHCMAVSDFSMHCYLSMEELAGHIMEMNLQSQPTSKEDIIKHFQDLVPQEQKKISSKDDICMFMKRTPKIINMIKKISPETFLIGFKLLSGGSFEDLLASARIQILENDSDFVLANDTKNIGNGKHEAVLIDRHGDILGSFETKDHIAAGLVKMLVKKGVI
ncbi:phosphopantothenoylcysteine decarboxylase [Alkalibacter saccharofermentans]|uniref:Phosphopantothenate-cysteine ligase n=1 Tax=Alkalibacter saccharofermentans DSM 14828 TaxID=1120975 RepID=A0A1M4Y124_9FIRM|nr:phosphopantothenoylcysteine decarboxylase [Alkalibacter saccharofermentans]SHE99405.1 phosphopantothenate-cysteine ligase [Alkalibacter saccharofermentans DSM 14828]